jgi:hypothetical protein
MGPPTAMTTLESNRPDLDSRRVPVFTRTLYRHLQDQGYTREQIIGVSAELLNLLSSDLRAKEEPFPAE